MQLLYTRIAWVSIFFGLMLFIFSKLIVTILYGNDFQGASSILTINVWAGTFAMLGSARGVWTVTEGLQRYNMFYVGAGAIINVALNFLLIPKIGGYGAAVATLMAQITVAIVAPLFIKQTRISAIMMLKAFKLEGVLKK